MVILVDHPDVDHPDVASEVPHCLGAVDAIRAKVQTEASGHGVGEVDRAPVEYSQVADPAVRIPSDASPRLLRCHDFCRATESGEYRLNLVLFTGMPEQSWQGYYYESLVWCN